MGKNIKLVAGDGHELGAYRAKPENASKVGMIVIQEIFGVNSHIRDICDGYAMYGFNVIAPAVFDRAERDTELDYSSESVAKGRALRAALNWDETLLDIEAALAELKKSCDKVGLVGYCYGGSAAWVAASRLKGLDCAIGYYGGQIIDFIAEAPKCPTMLHFGKLDAMIPMVDVDVIAKTYPDVSVFKYEADHGFNCSNRSSYNPESASLALERSLAFFEASLR